MVKFLCQPLDLDLQPADHGHSVVNCRSTHTRTGGPDVAVAKHKTSQSTSLACLILGRASDGKQSMKLKLCLREATC